MKNWYETDIKNILNELNIDANVGLSQDQILKKQNEFGKNVFTSNKKTSLIKKILLQLKDVSIIVLLIATALSFVLAFIEGSGFVEPIVILAIVILNVILAITQEGKAEKALEALADMNTPTCICIRDSVRQSIETSELVVGDIIILETGNIVPADARLIETTGLFSDESALTGESEPVEKDATTLLTGEVGIGDQENMVFSGCVVTAGHAVAVVTAIGMDTQMGQIASFLHDTEQVKTPLQSRLDKLGKLISWIAIGAALFLLAIGLRGGTDFKTMIMIAISMAVAAVPETLSLIVTLSLTNGVQKMVNKNALIRKLPAVETLGNTSVICSDKTGTLTQNRMAIKELWVCGEEPFPADIEFNDKQKQFVTMLAMASNATIEIDKDGEEQTFGNATEVAIMRLFAQKECSKLSFEEYPKVAEIAFSSERKRMTVVVEDKDYGYTVLTKGALDRLPLKNISIETHYVHDTFAEKALRVIAIAAKHIDVLPDADHLYELESDMTLIGLVGMIDPPRPEAAVAIEKAKKAGIRTIMITGDHAVTAGAIAKELGILTEGQNILTGAQLAKMTDQELYDTVRNYSVYARVSPEDKIRIVEAWQVNGEVVAMTGDGINDAPALKAADVGIAMGKTGTEVAKNASDMILTDDNFATIVEAVNEGRNVYENIKKTIYFLLVCNFSEIVIMLFAQMAGWGILLTPIMLLLINLLGDGIPGLQLSYEISEEDIMSKQPTKRDESFFTGDLIRKILRQTLACSVVSLIAYYIGAFVSVSSNVLADVSIGQTMAFLTVGWTSIIHILHVRNNKSVFKSSLKTNKPLLISSIAMIVVFALLVITPIGSIFGLTNIGLIHWIIVIGLSLIPTVVREIGRLIDNTRPRILERRRDRRIKLHERINYKNV